MKKLLFMFGCLLSASLFVRAQEQLSIKELADKLFERYEYFKCLPLYVKLDKGRKTNVNILERIADCYRNINQYDSTEVYYARVNADAKASRISHLHYAEVLQRNQKFDMAKQQYRLYYSDDPAALAFKLSVCDSAKLWLSRPSAYKIKNDTIFNTPYSDWGLTYDGKSNVIFTSDRPDDNREIDERTGNNWFKLYSSTIKGDEIKQLALVADSDNLYSDYHIGPIVLNKTADTAYITIAIGISKKQLTVDPREKQSIQKLYSRRLLLVTACKRDGRWAIFGSFPYNNIQKYSVGDAALSKDGKLIYFKSDMPGGQGKTDIWYCEKQRDGKWGSPVNCGKTINTKDEEAFPTIGDNGDFYYASKGLPGMGGYDIYKAKGSKNEWSKPENLRFPINTTSDDFYLTTRDGLTGYLSSNRAGGKGSDDIYSFAHHPVDTIPLKIITSVATATPGPPKVSVPVSKPVVPPVVVTPGLVLSTIYYDLDKSNIRHDAAIELDKLVITMQQHPGLKIELSSYTDSRASAQYNIALSQRRAKAVVVYLVNRGIDKNRLVPHYYGETNLVNGCTDGVPCTGAEHQLNRRTEFKVMEVN